MSKEREALFKMIEEREESVRALNLSIDRLYDEHGTQAMVLGGHNVHEKINGLYAEILLLKMVLVKADEDSR